MDSKGWLAIGEVAQRLGISAQTVRNLISKEGLPAYRLGDYKINPEELDRWLLTRKTS